MKENKKKMLFFLKLPPLPLSLCYHRENKAFQRVKKCLVKMDVDQELGSWSGIDITVHVL